MTDEELFQGLGKIETREGKERKIKSYVLRNNVLTDKERETVRRYMPRYGFFFRDAFFHFADVGGKHAGVE